MENKTQWQDWVASIWTTVEGDGDDDDDEPHTGWPGLQYAF